MARPYTPKVNGHIQFRTISAGGPPASKWQRAIITAVTDSTHVSLRVVHTGQTAVGAVKGPAAGQVPNGQWKPGG